MVPDGVAAMSVRAFCQRYGIGRSTAYAFLANGTLRAVKVGRRTLIRVDDAENWLNSLPNFGARREETPDR